MSQCLFEEAWKTKKNGIFSSTASVLELIFSIKIEKIQYVTLNLKKKHYLFLSRRS